MHYASIIGFNPRRLKVPQKGWVPLQLTNGLCKYLLLLHHWINSIWTTEKVNITRHITDHRKVSFNKWRSWYISWRHSRARPGRCRNIRLFHRYMTCHLPLRSFPATDSLLEATLAAVQAHSWHGHTYTWTSHLVKWVCYLSTTKHTFMLTVWINWPIFPVSRC